MLVYMKTRDLETGRARLASSVEANGASVMAESDPVTTDDSNLSAVLDFLGNKHQQLGLDKNMCKLNMSLKSSSSGPDQRLRSKQKLRVCFIPMLNRHNINMLKGAV